MIHIENLSKRYRKDTWVLRDIDLNLNEGMVGLLGPNGAGKTTLMRILATLVPPTSGEAVIAGIPLNQPDELRRIIGYLPQQFQVYPQLTGLEFLDYVGVMKGLTDAKIRRAEIDRVIEEVNLQDKAAKRVKTYSGGMRRRLGIAQALLGSPRVLIVDEPTVGLDPQERVRFRNLLTRFSMGRIVLLSTHIVADIESNCRQIAVLDRGAVKLAGDLADLQRCGENRVWEARLSEMEFARLDPASIVTTHREEEGVLCRIIGEKQPVSSAVTVSPSLEEGYLSLLRLESKEGELEHE
ncbi:ABC transporter ATP-binding protein [Paenibacillus sp. J22TS3]|uniref:ABC transporter ATP-binding protein n=1 Tax=Paenibacillus sp. J22TS3 TaxID=2807192 RepID=UPI001B1FD3CA|nr:ABC transporter ATP-binding protein [Paenibacillus sp. J22TS3]GIP24440.1 ABC transporter ATP-binding protein [Paenibacillus sp. J22TS3]